MAASRRGATDEMEASSHPFPATFRDHPLGRSSPARSVKRMLHDLTIGSFGLDLKDVTLSGVREVDLRGGPEVSRRLVAP